MAGSVYGNRRTHGMRKTRLYNIWANMILRVTHKVGKRWHRYVGRGITVCDEWRKFAPFAEWALANGYADNLQIDRVDNDGNYEPGNCRWVTHVVNCRNRPNTTVLTAFGRTQNLFDWAEEYGIEAKCLYARIKRYGMTVEQALTHKKYVKREGVRCV